MNLRAKIMVIFMLVSTALFCQEQRVNVNSEEQESNTVQRKHSIGASFFMLGNFLSDSPDYYLLTYGYRISEKDRIFAEFNTWKYAEPLGTYNKSGEFYPGYIRSFGVGIGYQRFLWKGVFTTLQATPFLKQYHDLDNTKIQNGFQLYLQLIAGYRFEFFNNRFYLEPAYALKYWPIDTNFPVHFAEIDEGTPKYIFEPSLNFGYKF